MFLNRNFVSTPGPIIDFSNYRGLSHFVNYAKYFIQHLTVKVNSICRGNYCGSSVLIWTKQVSYWVYVVHVLKTKETMGIQLIGESATYRLQESLRFS